jgi:uncharacterized protein YndB with AHSA1/START domain
VTSSFRTTDDAVHCVVEIAVPPERVFAALTDPAELEAWWGSPEAYRGKWTLDLRVGGKWESHVTSADGTKARVHGEVLAVDPPRLLSYTWHASWDQFAKTTIRYELEPIPVGTRLTVVHSGFRGREASQRSHYDGWSRVLAWMAGYVEGRRSAPA